MAEEFKIIAKIVTDDKQAKVSAEATGKEIAKKVDSGAEKAKFGDTLNKQFDKIKKNTFADDIKGKLEDVKKGIQAIGVGGDRLSKIGDFFQGGMIAAFAAAALMAAQALKKMWDDAHESAEQYYERMQKNQEILDRAIEKAQAENQATNDWFNRLHEINNLEKISNAQKAEAAILIENLTRKYGQLGITVDGTSGKYQNLYQAQLKVLDLQYESELRLRQQKRDSYTGTGGTAHAAASGLMGKIGLVRVVGKSTLDTEIDRSRYNTIGQAKNMGLDVRMRQDQKRVSRHVMSGQTVYTQDKADQAQIEANKAWNNGGLQGKLKWVQYMRNNKEYRGDADFQSLLNNLEKQILEAMIASDQFSAFKATGRPSEQKALQDVSANNRRIQQQRAKGEDVEKQNAERRRIQQQQAEYQALDTQGKIDQQTRKNSEAKTEITRATAEVKRLQAEYQQSDNDLAETIKSGDVTKIEVAQKQHLELLQRLNAEKQQLQDARNTQQSSKLEIQRLKQQLAREQQQQGNNGNGSGTSSKTPLAENYYRQSKQQAEYELRYQKLLLQGLFSEAEELRVINDLKKQGLKLSASQIDEIVTANSELADLAIQREIVSLGKGIMQGKGSKKQQLKAEADEIINAMEQANKRFLSQSEKADVRELLKLREKLNSLPSVESYQIQATELTRRGGFKTGYVDNSTKIQQQIASNTQKSTQYLREIKNIQDKYSKY